MAKPVIKHTDGAYYVNGNFVCWDFASPRKLREIADYEHCCGSPRTEDNLRLIADHIEKGRG